jgi:hypothetical protein
MDHRYFYLNRPPAYAHQPDGFTARDGGLPSKDWTCDRGVVHAFGWVEYAQPLTFDEIANWEFTPADSIEWAHYAFWLFANKDLADQEYYEADYLAAYREGMLSEHREGLYLPAKILSEAAQ